MDTLLRGLRYLRLKFLISITRFLLQHLSPPITATPDAILHIPSRDKTRSIKAHLYNPRKKSTGSSPVLLNFYGGGFALPLHGADDAFCQHIALSADHFVLDVEYSVGPERPFPAALHDAEDAVRYVLSQSEQFDASRVSLSGFSSGGTLALSVAFASAVKDTIKSVIAFYPATDLASDPSERRVVVPGVKKRSPFWTRVFREAYVGDSDARDPRISPAFAQGDFLGKKMLVVTAEEDTSVVEAEELVEKVRGQGGDVVLSRVEGCGHGFDKKSKPDAAVRGRDETYGLVVKMLRELL